MTGSSTNGAPATAPGTGSPATVPNLLSPNPNPGQNKGYESKPYENRSPIQTQPGLKPTPDSNTGPAPAKMPSLGAPQGRTAQRAIRPATYVRPVSHESQTGSPTRPRQDSNGWEAAGD